MYYTITVRTIGEQTALVEAASVLEASRMVRADLKWTGLVEHDEVSIEQVFEYAELEEESES